METIKTRRRAGDHLSRFRQNDAYLYSKSVVSDRNTCFYISILPYGKSQGREHNLFIIICKKHIFGSHYE